MARKKDESNKIIEYRIMERMNAKGYRKIAPLARDIGYSRESISRSIHKGEMKQMMLLEISKILDVSPNYLNGNLNVWIDPDTIAKDPATGEMSFKTTLSAVAYRNDAIDSHNYYIPSFREYMNGEEYHDSKKSLLDFIDTLPNNYKVDGKQVTSEELQDFNKKHIDQLLNEVTKVIQMYTIREL